MSKGIPYRIVLNVYLICDCVLKNEVLINSKHLALFKTPLPFPIIIKTMSTPTIEIVFNIANGSTGALMSRGRGSRPLKECAHCHTWSGNASKACKSCKRTFPAKTTTRRLKRRKTRQGISLKICDKCGTMANSNNQRICKNAGCGHDFSRGSATPEKTSAAPPKKKRRTLDEDDLLKRTQNAAAALLILQFK